MTSGSRTRQMHWAAHGHTAAEVIAERVDASLPNMGLASWSGAVPRKADVTVARNYLSAEEIEALNRVVSAYLEFAELQAIRRHLMHMADWIAKLDDFLRLSDRDVLEHAGKITHEQAELKAHNEYSVLAKQRAELPALVEAHFEEAVSEAHQLASARAIKGKKP